MPAYLSYTYGHVHTSCAGGHFSTAFWFPEIERGIHFDTYADAQLYELAQSAILPFIETCSKQTIELLRKDRSAGIEEQPKGSNVCGFTSTHFLYEALEKLRSLNYAELKQETSHTERQRKLYNHLANLETRAITYERWRREACDDIDVLINEYKEHRKRKAADPSVSDALASKRRLVDASEGFSPS